MFLIEKTVISKTFKASPISTDLPNSGLILSYPNYETHANAGDILLVIVNPKP